MMKILLIYLLVVNAAGFLLMRSDKKRAINNRWRIQENTLLIVAILGGSLGSITGMHAFHHKTRHPKFYIGLPLILALQIIAGVICISHIK
ncbi:MAG: DUF1294 domain-containing protein [Oscillospiraceae bacterium]|nr:DUF1294 domain-containing protein [Oscillospiraceae bacterium]